MRKLKLSVVAACAALTGYCAATAPAYARNIEDEAVICMSVDDPAINPNWSPEARAHVPVHIV